MRGGRAEIRDEQKADRRKLVETRHRPLKVLINDQKSPEFQSAKAVTTEGHVGDQEKAVAVGALWDGSGSCAGAR